MKDVDKWRMNEIKEAAERYKTKSFFEEFSEVSTKKQIAIIVMMLAIALKCLKENEVEKNVRKRIRRQKRR